LLVKREARSTDQHGHEDGADEVRLAFRAHGRDFRLSLRRDHSVFGDTLDVVDGDDRRLERAHDVSHLYEGVVHGEDKKSLAEKGRMEFVGVQLLCQTRSV